MTTDGIRSAVVSWFLVPRPRRRLIDLRPIMVGMAG